MSETTLSKGLAAFIRDEGGWCRKTHGGPQGSGWPDLVGTIFGVFLGLEVKLPGKEHTLTKLQGEVLAGIRASGGIGMLVSSKADVEYALVLARFASKLYNYRVNPETECWEWQGTRTQRGYGGIAFRRGGKRFRCNTSRVTAAVYHGMDLRDKQLLALHTCDNPPCINPSHLFVGTQQDNLKDMVAKGRAYSGPRPWLEERRVFTAGQIKAIKRAYTRGGVTQLELAEQYGVSQHQISRTVNGKAKARAS